jgi:hypothetical protein
MPPLVCCFAPTAFLHGESWVQKMNSGQSIASIWQDDAKVLLDGVVHPLANRSQQI